LFIIKGQEYQIGTNFLDPELINHKKQENEKNYF